MIEPTWKSECGRVRLFFGDCLDVLPHVKVDAVIQDPPYGMNNDTDNSRFSGGNSASVSRRGNGVGTGKGKPIIDDDRPFIPFPFLDFPIVVLWGSNHFARALPVGTTLVWIKRNDAAFGSFLSDAELAWMKGGCGVYCKRDLSMTAEALTRVHPNQKPVSLMVWCMSVAKVPEGATVFDGYAGSGSVGLACIKTGRKYIGCEKDHAHFPKLLKRIQDELAQPYIPSLAPERHVPVELPL